MCSHNSTAKSLFKRKALRHARQSGTKVINLGFPMKSLLHLMYNLQTKEGVSKLFLQRAK